MTDQDRALIAYRMDRAHQAVEEAKLMFDSGHTSAYVNRLYYACFYAVSALLLTKNISTSRHGHLRSVLHRDFVRTGIVPNEHGRHFDLLFNKRQQGDYADLVHFQAEEVADWYETTQAFVKCIESLLAKML